MKVLKIGAVWCNSCNVMRPRWKQIEAENEWVRTEYYEFDDHPEIMKKYDIQDEALPVFIFLDEQGNELTRLSGEPSKDLLMKQLEIYKNK